MELERAAEMLRGANKIMLFTGAGVSTESGIPDFRGPEGVWTKVDPSEFTLQQFVASADTRRRSWAMRADSTVMEAKPNPAHLAIVRLWQAGRMIGCVTQNIDELHRQAGLPDEAIVELHGTALRAGCLDCDNEWPTAEIMTRVSGGDDDPHCECGGIIKALTISFGQPMPRHEMERASEMAARCDAALSVGSTLSVYPAAYIPLEAKERGVPYGIINVGHTDQDHLADFRIEGKAGVVLPALVEALSA